MMRHGTFKYGLGYFDKIKERNSDEFVSMAEDAGADVDRGVYTAGGLYQKGDFSIGAIDYYSPDIINIGYAEAKMAWEIDEDWKPRFAAQFIDQRSVGDDLLQDEDFLGAAVRLQGGIAVRTGAFHRRGDAYHRRRQHAEPVERVSRLHQRAGRGLQPGRGDGVPAPGRHQAALDRRTEHLRALGSRHRPGRRRPVREGRI